MLKLNQMKKVSKLKTLGVLILTMLFTSMLAQRSQVVILGNAQFGGDSLAGFDEEAARKAALSEGFYGNEFPVRMYKYKREFVNAKYNLKIAAPKSIWGNTNGFKSAVVAGCNNEDFEASAAGPVTSSGQITGWTITSGTNQFPSNSCNLTGCCPNPPMNSQLITAPATGYVDNVIGAQYPIYSVFGTSNNNGIGVNPQLGIPAMFGTNFLRLNDAVTGDYSMEKLSKTFAVTANNALFQIAYISVFYPGHGCCDAGAFQIKVLDQNNNPLACPAVSVSAPSSACTSTNPLTYFVAGTNNVYTGSTFGPIYNKWRLQTLDLTSYINQNITIEIVASDCTAGGHYGYVYVDAQCSPMAVIGNNSSFPAGTPSITLPTCGASGATITLPSGLGPYSWQGPGVPGPFTVPSMTNQTYVTAVSGTLNAIMNPAGACAPIIRNITVSVTPAPNLILTPLQPSCSNSVASLTGTLTVGATPMTVVQTGPLGTVAVNVTGNTLFSGSLTPGNHTVSVTDAIGCKITQVVTINPPLAIPSFTVGSPGADYTLTCINNPITMTASSTSPPPLNYTWTSSGGTLTGASANVSQPGVWQVVGQHPVSGCSVSATFTISQNFTQPTIVVTPTVANITCAGGSGCFTVTSNLGPNVTTNWYQVVGSNTVYVGVPQGTINIYCAGQPGVYWAESVNNLTGCRSTKSVQVTASVGLPIFTVTSSSNFTIGCSTSSITSMQVSNVITSPVASVACQYTFVPPGFTGTPTTFSFNPNQNNITIPGTWVVYVRDQTNNCVASQSISIIQNTIAPNVNYLQPLSLLTCRDNSMVLTGISSNSNTTITWTVPAIPSNSINPTPNATVVINPAATGATANITSVGIWTVGAVDNNNLCRATKTVQIIQDIRIPRFTASAASNSIINCKDPNVLIVPVITNTLAAALVPTYTWFPPSGGEFGGSSFNTTASGQHTVTSMSTVNGCTASSNYNVASDLTPPALAQGLTFTLDCATNPTVAITAAITGPTTGLTFNWVSFPTGVVVSNPSVATIVGTKIGDYAVVVTNTINGCKSNAAYDVIQGELSVDFTPSQTTGFAPLSVTFVNNSASAFNTGSMIATWSYGNGSILTNTYTNGSSAVTPAATYTAAGTYSVLLEVDKGACTGSKIKVITVEVPSKLEVPNVFTPNGDKVNDIFRLIAASLGDIEATIFDRWGNKVYEVVSGTGNIAWDGKNMAGKECPAGTYFYMIKATGKDGEEYDLKGNVTLFR